MKWTDLTTTAIEDLVRSDPVAILPVAAVEQHGPHLPLSTDVVIGEGLLDQALLGLEDVPTVVLPTQAVGASLEHVGIPGTISLPASLFEETLVHIGSSLASTGLRRLVVSNSHGGNKGALDSAALRLRAEHGLLVVKANYFRFPRPEGVTLPDAEWIHGLHGGAVETSMMLYLRPDLVQEEEIDSFDSLGQDLGATMTRVAPEGVAPFAWLARDLNPDGVVGDAGLATEEKGRWLVEHYGSVLAEVIRDAHAFPLDRLTTDGA